MYGIINKSIEEQIIENYGENKWIEIKANSGISEDFFISNDVYDDAVTYKLIQSISNVLKISTEVVLFNMGEWWILNTTHKKYAGLIKAGGKNLNDFIINLPDFHNHIMLMYPKISAPEFKVTRISENEILLHYYSKRAGLQEFVRGLLSGLGKIYQTAIFIELVQSKNSSYDHDTFKVSWTI